MSQLKYWIKAFRLRTLPLALSTIWMGSVAAALFNAFRLDVCILATFTTLCLQILSNLANDYGDASSGADKTRIGPARMVQSGHIKPKQMMAMMVVFAVLSFVSGIGLLYIAFPSLFSVQGMLFLVLGLASIGAAINYTVGKNPYGYKGWGDFFVFVFFGLLGVFGTFYLHAHHFQPLVLLPAVAIGFLSIGVLNVNNLRDCENDARTGKRSLVVIWGVRFGVAFQLSMVTMAMILMAIFACMVGNGPFIWLCLMSFPMFVVHLYKVVRLRSGAAIDPELKRLSLTTFAMVLLFIVGYFLSR
jgi:1,4-dihydroxy-2-naphthoate polyprenyltransferase